MRPLALADLEEMVTASEDVFRALGGARIFLTGATGFYGIWLLSALGHARRRLGVDVEVTVLSRDPASARARYGAVLEGVELVAGDTRSFAFPDGTFSHVVHGATAASAALNEKSPLEMFDVILEGTRRVLELAQRTGCQRFLLMSSGAVYGPQPSELTHVPETYGGGPSPLDPANAYAEGKRAAEQMAAIVARAARFELVAARGFAFVGPWLPLDTHFAIGNFVRDALAGGPIRILGDGTPYRSYMYGTDLATWMWTLLARGKNGTAYNVGSEDGRPLREMAARVGEAAGVAVHVAKEPPPGALPSRYVPRTTRARDELGLELRVGLDEAIRRTLDYHRG
jgi:dTDP-glucose 4,6-dehydratase